MLKLIQQKNVPGIKRLFRIWLCGLHFVIACATIRRSSGIERVGGRRLSVEPKSNPTCGNGEMLQPTCCHPASLFLRCSVPPPAHLGPTRLHVILMTFVARSLHIDDLGHDLERGGSMHTTNTTKTIDPPLLTCNSVVTLRINELHLWHPLPPGYRKVRPWSQSLS